MSNTINWKITTVFLSIVNVILVLIIIIMNLTFQKKIFDLATDITPLSVVQNYTTPTPDLIKPTFAQQSKDESSNLTVDNFSYPSSAFFLSTGYASISQINNNSLNDQFFSLTLLPHGENSLSKTFVVPISNIDYVDTPLISHDEKYGCVGVGASGYWGYYIFGLPNGDKIDQGEQYSTCVEWIDDHRVIIVEKPYWESETSYSILDVITGKKQQISQIAK